MTRRLRVVAVAFASLLSLAACQSPRKPIATAVPAPAAPARAIAVGIEPVARGEGQGFRLCADCIARTPKTRAQVDLGNMPVAMARSVEAVAAASSAPSPARLPAPAAAEAQQAETVLVFFDSDSAELRAAARDRLAGLDARLRAASRIELTGYTDDLGSTAWNQTLARLRAEAVAQHLRRQVGAAAAISVQSRARCCYVAENRGPAQRAANRRVEIRIGPALAPVAGLASPRPSDPAQPERAAHD